MRLGFYLERRYAPYAKWFGTAFRRLSCAQRLHEPLARVLDQSDAQAAAASLID